MKLNYRFILALMLTNFIGAAVKLNEFKKIPGSGLSPHVIDKTHIKLEPIAGDTY